jgi:hypothetical protein
MQYLQIKNNGCIDAMAFELIGASTKRNDINKIGQFGSGLKYSIAWLLRNEIPFIVYSGPNEIKFSKKVEEFRGQVFERIIINGKETSYTTDMGGVDWEAWFVIREIWCNALDEGSEQMDVKDEFIPELDEMCTTFSIGMTAEIQQVVDDWDLYFSNNRKEMIAQVGEVKVFPGGQDLIIYRKGVQCYFKKNERCAFHYDLPDVDINESRVARDVWSMEWSLTKWWTTLAPKDLIKRLIREMTGKYEFTLKWELLDYNMKEQWVEAIGNRMIVEEENAGHYGDLVAANKPLMLPKTLTFSLLNAFKGKVHHVGGEEGEEGMLKREFNEKQLYMLDKVKDFCKECEYAIDYPVQLVQFKRIGIRGQASNGKIYLSDMAFESMGTLIKIMIEENEHLISGFDDESRAFQDHFIKLFMEEKLKRFAFVV